MKKHLALYFFLIVGMVFLSKDGMLFSSPIQSSKKNQIQLGRYLFFDNNISYNQTKSCASCHDPQFAFTDGYRKSVGADGENLKRNAPSLLNAKYLHAFTWADSAVHSLADQLVFPLFNDHPNELGWKSHESEIINRFISNPFYQNQFKQAFPNDKYPYTFGHFMKAIQAYEEQLVALNSAYDRYVKGNKMAISENAKRGLRLFQSVQLSCNRCHSLDVQKQPLLYENTGLYNIDTLGSYPTADQGLFLRTKTQKDNGKFRVPSLRNVMITAPYAHDGSVATIEEMLLIYQRGGRLIESDENKGDGKLNKNKSSLIKGFNLTNQERMALIEFLATLTDTSYLQNKQWMNPFQ